ncbi:Solute carrier family 46 member 3 [Aphis craccivora]|uniref:Solute carrier family 46 member 3 n=1 Tax=Aphis craccivora TaxID=307492 RepID=A0A6G0Z9W0_APHCR|nr:Solute carrier family 46 member 3 [Aphis craccivora]
MEMKEEVNVSTPGDEDSNSWQGLGFCSKVKYVFRNITVEPLLAFFQVSSVLSTLTTQNLNLQKACRVNLKLSDDVCDGLENKNMSFYADQEVQVQQQVADMLIWQTIIQSSIPCILVIFIGSWSDRNGKRKPCMLVPVVGEIIRNIGLLICVFYFNELKMEVAGLVESIPTSMAGGLTVLYLAAFSYIGDISSVSKTLVFLIELINIKH